MGTKIKVMLLWPAADDFVHVLIVAFGEVTGFPVHKSHVHHPTSLRAVIVGEVADWWREARWNRGVGLNIEVI